jgi:sec-independent protein translocase protein TatA
VILVFGAAKLPDLARGTGQALRIFKSETKGLRDDDKDATSTDPAPQAADPAQLPPAAPAPTAETTQDPQVQRDQHQG